MDKSKKQTINRNNYLKNRERILVRARERWKKKSKSTSNVIPFLNYENAVIKHSRNRSRPTSRKFGLRLKLSPEVYFLCPLIALMTWYLVSESAKFYQFAEGDHLGAYFKAIIAEGIFLTFSALRGQTASLRWLYRGVLILAGIYCLWALSSKAVAEGLNHGVVAIQNQKAVTELETELKSQTNARDRLVELNRLTRARGYDPEINQIQIQLKKMRDALVQAGSPLALANTVLTLILFRTLVMVANALCVKRLKRGIRFRPYPAMGS